MQFGVNAPRLSRSGTTAALCGALVFLLGSIVLLGWAIHSTFLIQVARNFAPMQPNTALSFLLSGIALLGIAIAKPRLTVIVSAITATISIASVLEYLFRANLGIDDLLRVAFVTTLTPIRGRMSPATALCFTVFAVVAILAQHRRFARRSPLFGVTGLLVAAVGAACCIGVLSGTNDAFAWGNLNRVAIHTGIGFVLLGIGLAALALDVPQLGLRESLWISIGAGVFVATFRIGLWQAFAARNQHKSDFLTNLTLWGEYRARFSLE